MSACLQAIFVEDYRNAEVAELPNRSSQRGLRKPFNREYMSRQNAGHNSGVENRIKRSVLLGQDMQNHPKHRMGVD
jgi:hypothetical protein